MDTSLMTVHKLLGCCLHQTSLSGFGNSDASRTYQAQSSFYSKPQDQEATSGQKQVQGLIKQDQKPYLLHLSVKGT
jgi:hypothetical protein